jgi:NADH-dependent peroxiredoxin subunit F
MYDLIVIGGGPAGLTAAIYAIRKRLNVLLVTEDLGGKTNYRMEVPGDEPYLPIRGREVVENFRNELEYLQFARDMEGVARVTVKEEHFIVHTKGGGELEAQAIIIATGARMQPMGVPGEKEFLGRGLGYSALSYAPFFIDKRTVVVGDGSLALRSAAELAIVAEHVHLVGPGSDQLESPLGEKLSATSNVTILKNYQVSAIHGNGYADRILVKGPDGEELEIPTDGVFVEKTLLPNSELVYGLVELDKDKRIVVDCAGQTSIPGLFAAGDVTTTSEQVLIAVGEGAKAALSAYEYFLPSL